MRIKKAISVGTRVLGARFLEKRMPLNVSFALNNRCNYSCTYCTRWEQKTEELKLEQIQKIIDDLVEMGTENLALTGGEPLIREDIGEIIDYVKQKDIRLSINSNGTLVPKKIKKLAKINLLTLSYDGPNGVQKNVRGKECYDDVVKAIQTAQVNNIPLRLYTVITKNNVDSLGELLKFSRNFDTAIGFSPVRYTSYSDSKMIDAIVPSREKYMAFINNLILEKKRGNKYITNSLTGLEHIKNWPKHKKIRCCAGRIYCRIEPNGDLYPCGDLLNSKVEPFNVVDLGLKRAFAKMKPDSCQTCWCNSRVEMNSIYDLNLEVILNTVKYFGS